jgi:hypothetical protein
MTWTPRLDASSSQQEALSSSVQTLLLATQGRSSHMKFKPKRLVLA